MTETQEQEESLVTEFIETKKKNYIPSDCTLYEIFKKCLQCTTYNPGTNKKCYSCGYLFYREAEPHELEEYNKRYQIDNMVVSQE